MIRRIPVFAYAIAFALLALFGIGLYLTIDHEPHTAAGPESDRSAIAPLGDQPSAAARATDPLVTALNEAAQGDVDGALAKIEALHQEQPDAPGPYLGLAEIAVKKGDLEGADAWLSKGLAVAPNVAEFYRARARLLLLQKKDEEAVALFEKAISLAPRDVRARIEIADLYATRLNQPEKSVDYFKDAIAVEPNNATAHYGLGVALARMHRTEEARTVLAKAQKLAPKNPMPSFVLGQVYVQEKRYPDALAAFDMALLIQPALTVARIARGDVLQGTQRYDEAIAEYRLALDTDPKSVNALLGLGMTQEAAGRFAEAEKSYKAVIALDPDQPLALNNLAWLASTQNGNLDEALGWAKKAVALAGGQAAFHDTLGWVYYQRHELAEASEALEQAVQLKPAAVTYAHLGTVRAALGEKDAAAEAFRKALTIAPTYQPALDGLHALQ